MGLPPVYNILILAGKDKKKPAGALRGIRGKNRN
jgi:hypothetical protein